MFFMKKTVSFLAFMACFSSVFAVTARPSVVTTVASRSNMPNFINPNNQFKYTTTNGRPATTVTTTVTGTTNLMDNAECIDAYTECITGSDACGTNFEECTTTELFHGQMAKCSSTLYQCKPDGITALFGTNSVTALGTVSSGTAGKEDAKYAYPTDTSIMGQRVAGGAISNRYDTSQCVKKYTNCVHKDTVCGPDFELCTGIKEFKKQMSFCASTLVRCPKEGIIALFGKDIDINPDGSLKGTVQLNSADSRIGQMIDDGAALAAKNAVNTCYKVVDSCIIGACAKNPFKCIEGTTTAQAETAAGAGDQTSDDILGTILAKYDQSKVVGQGSAAFTDAISNSDVAKYIRSACQDVIGTNKYCHLVFNDELANKGEIPSDRVVLDEDAQADVFAEAFATRMNASAKEKIKKLSEEFDARAKNKCYETIKSCAMRSCGNGNGAACYASVFGTSGSINGSINDVASYGNIQVGCAAIVNTNPYCIYSKMAVLGDTITSNTLNIYSDADAFATLFPAYDETNKTDPIGAVAKLNASLSSAFNAPAIAQKRKQCIKTAQNCVKSMCGDDYENCYRNRTDIMSGITKTTVAAYDNSMNKVGGVLDRTIVIGLCMNTVKNNAACEDHLAIKLAEISDTYANKNAADSWGDNNTVREGWLAGGISELNDKSEYACTNKDGESKSCDDYDASAGDQKYATKEEYQQGLAANTIFAEVLNDIEIEVQAKYNAKLTKEQNVCLKNNNGGVVGAFGGNDSGIYMWAKLKSGKVPSDYSTNGLEGAQLIASNDLYGSFCRVRVTMTSTDPKIKKFLEDNSAKATRYFAVGDAFICGSWLKDADMDKIEDAVRSDAISSADERRQKRNRRIATWAGILGGGVGGGVLGNKIGNGDILPNLTSNKDDTKNLNDCKAHVSYLKNVNTNSIISIVKNHLNGLSEPFKADENWATKTGEGCATTTTTTTTLSDCAAKMIKEFATSVDCSRVVTESKGVLKGKLTGAQFGTAIGATVGAVGVGIAAHKIAENIQEAKNDEAKDAAWEEFMTEIGSKIRCYIGTTEAGGYGDTVMLTVE